MIIEIGDKVVSTALFDEEFVCNLSACKGACCIEGDEGAPLSMEELNLLEDNVDKIKPYMTEEGKAAVEEKGVFYMDRENEPVTSLVNGAECAFVFRDEKGITKCSVEHAHRKGDITFNKPISCHLYPIRAAKYGAFTVLNYDRWTICSDACTLGKELQVSVYKFLKEPIIRAYGEEFYAELEKTDGQWQKDKKNL